MIWQFVLMLGTERVRSAPVIRSRRSLVRIARKASLGNPATIIRASGDGTVKMTPARYDNGILTLVTPVEPDYRLPQTDRKAILLAQQMLRGDTALIKAKTEILLEGDLAYINRKILPVVMLDSKRAMIPRHLLAQESSNHPRQALQ